MKDNNWPYIIALANQKGGSGKSVHSYSLAHGLNLKNIKTLLADCDLQRTVTIWHEAYKAENGGKELAPCVTFDPKNIISEIKRHALGYDVLVLDGPPQIAKETSSIINASDLILVPLHPASADVNSTAKMVEYIKEKQAQNDEKPDAAFIITRVIKNSILARNIGATVESFGLPALDSMTYQRMEYEKAQDNGNSIFYKKSTASLEFSKLVDEIIEKYISKRRKPEEKKVYKSLDITL